VDAAFFVASPKSSFVRSLLATEGLSLLSMERADAYTRVHRFLSKVTLPEGVVDFRENIPNKDVHLLAASATLVIREDFHPALVDLILQAASEVHGKGGIFESSYQFPSAQFVDFPIQKEALRYFKSGPPFLQKYLPFWAASLIDRLKVMLLPLLTLLIPLFKVVPPTYRWRVLSRITHWYRELGSGPAVENKDPEKLVEYLAELERIDREVASYGATSYASSSTVFGCICFVRKRSNRAAFHCLIAQDSVTLKPHRVLSTSLGFLLSRLQVERSGHCFRLFQRSGRFHLNALSRNSGFAQFGDDGLRASVCQLGKLRLAHGFGLRQTGKEYLRELARVPDF
jgi:hypothetical protein